MIPTTDKERKAIPVATGFLDYFPRAIVAGAEVSAAGSRQHHPDAPLHWDRSKSANEADSMMRHFLQRGAVDGDGILHSAKVFWRAAAWLEKELEYRAATGNPSGPINLQKLAEWHKTESSKKAPKGCQT